MVGRVSFSPFFCLPVFGLLEQFLWVVVSSVFVGFPLNKYIYNIKIYSFFFRGNVGKIWYLRFSWHASFFGVLAI